MIVSRISTSSERRFSSKAAILTSTSRMLLQALSYLKKLSQKKATLHLRRCILEARLSWLMISSSRLKKHAASSASSSVKRCAVFWMWALAFWMNLLSLTKLISAEVNRLLLLPFLSFNIKGFDLLLQLATDFSALVLDCLRNNFGNEMVIFVF